MRMRQIHISRYFCRICIDNDHVRLYKLITGLMVVSSLIMQGFVSDGSLEFIFTPHKSPSLGQLADDDRLGKLCTLKSCVALLQMHLGSFNKNIEATRPTLFTFKLT